MSILTMDPRDWKPKPKSYDPSCLALAQEFISDIPGTDKERTTWADLLAQHIQSEIEGWLGYYDGGPQTMMEKKDAASATEPGTQRTADGRREASADAAPSGEDREGAGGREGGT